MKYLTTELKRSKDGIKYQIVVVFDYEAHTVSKKKLKNIKIKLKYPPNQKSN